MTQELFDFIARELLEVSEDDYSTDTDLANLAAKYGLYYESEYWDGLITL
jgi:hypothetical protein